jgi:GNAT superfamily N-acetyltransferase
MYVEPEYRGFGINKLIIENLIDWSKEQGVFDLYLDVYDGNHAAIRAYEKVGFIKSLVEMKINIGV